jgi:3-oxoacyl-[acyl-carrier protein] reductase
LGKKINMKRLDQRVAIVTGGASGIGKAVAALFAAEGARVAIWDWNEERGQEAAAELNGKFYQVNTADFSMVEAAAQKTKEDFGKIDILINKVSVFIVR